MTKPVMNNPWHSENIAYCLNVHPGESLTEACDNIQRFAAGVRQQQQLDRMAVGAWISDQASRELSAEDCLHWYQNLQAAGCTTLTLNGFPMGNFHDKQVKETVYLPHWGDPQRRAYTERLIDILGADISADLSVDERPAQATISTVPLGFTHPMIGRPWDPMLQEQAEYHLCHTLQTLAHTEENTGRHIRLCLEMEPGCVLETSEEMIRFFVDHMTAALKRYRMPEAWLWRYLGVCFDVCHQAVMHENMAQSLAAFADAGVVIGKVQVSSALIVDPRLLDQQRSLLDNLADSPYLHQCYTQTSQGLQGVSDLPIALTSPQAFPRENPWHIHFHLPIQLAALDVPGCTTTQTAILDVLDYAAAHPQWRPHLEVETYTWQVMPKGLSSPSVSSQPEALIEAISTELTWLKQALQTRGLLLPATGEGGQ